MSNMCEYVPGPIKNRTAVNKILEETRGKLPKGGSRLLLLWHVRTIIGHIVAVVYVMCLPVSLTIAAILIIVRRDLRASLDPVKFLCRGFASEAAWKARKDKIDRQKLVDEMRESLVVLGDDGITAKKFSSNFANVLSNNWRLHNQFKQDECIDFNQAISITLKINPNELIAPYIWGDLFRMKFQQCINAGDVCALATGMRSVDKNKNFYTAVWFIIFEINEQCTDDYLRCINDECGLCGLFFLQCLLGPEKDKPKWEDFLVLKNPAHKSFVTEQISDARRALHAGQWPKGFNLLPPQSTV
jgi:hypothetical protein